MDEKAMCVLEGMTVTVTSTVWYLTDGRVIEGKAGQSFDDALLVAESPCSTALVVYQP